MKPTGKGLPMQKFDHVLLASDFDNTLVYTQSALDNGTDIPPMCPRNREALDLSLIHISEPTRP